MAITQTSLYQNLATSQFQDTALGNSADSVKLIGGTIYSIVIDNTLNAAATYVKLYNVVSSSVTIGATAPDMIILAPASLITTITTAIAFSTAIAVAAVTAGGTAGSTSPSSSVVATIKYA